MNPQEINTFGKRTVRNKLLLEIFCQYTTLVVQKRQENPEP